MELKGLDYNTQREKLKLKAYGRGIQQMIDYCCTLPTKEERQRCAENIITTMRRVVPSQQNQNDRMPALWYHLALMSNFRLDIDYPYEFEREDKMAQKPDAIAYTNKRQMQAKHYGRLLFGVFERLKAMAPGEERDTLAMQTAAQMHRCLVAWDMGSADRKRVASDLRRYTDGVIAIDPDKLKFDTNGPQKVRYGQGATTSSNNKKKNKK